MDLICSPAFDPRQVNILIVIVVVVVVFIVTIGDQSATVGPGRVGETLASALPLEQHAVLIPLPEGLSGRKQEGTEGEMDENDGEKK